MRDHYPEKWGKLAEKYKMWDPVVLPPVNAGKSPSMLLMGDSISLCYAPHVKRLLGDSYAIHRIPHNGAGTLRGLQSIDAYLSAGPFDVVIFNWGLHDLVLRPDARTDKSRWNNSTPVEVYKRRLDALVSRLASGARQLVWIDTTPVAKAPRYRAADVALYNSAARQVMAARGIAMVDLQGATAPAGGYEFHPDGVHFTAAGCRDIGETVVAELRKLGIVGKP
ncbi:MAG: SGNH/GDSL hydrolase family protein [Hyphomicrobiaceae bacterium]